MKANPMHDFGPGTLYVGNLSFYTTEAQIYAAFGIIGPIKRVVMGLNRNTKLPCGFCFVEYHSTDAALEACAMMTGWSVDDRIIRVELDFGFRDGRQYGRGGSGGQVRDDRRVGYDEDRGGEGGGTERARGGCVSTAVPRARIVCDARIPPQEDRAAAGGRARHQRQVVRRRSPQNSPSLAYRLL